MRNEGKQYDRCFQICKLMPLGAEREKGEKSGEDSTESVERGSGQKTKRLGRAEGGGYRHLPKGEPQTEQPGSGHTGEMMGEANKKALCQTQELPLNAEVFRDRQ